MKIFFGNDRAKAQRMIERILGTEYEVIEGEELKLEDMPSAIFGATLFSDKRKILIKDLALNTECFNKLVDYVDTPNEVVLLEMKLDKRAAAVKALEKAGVEMVKCETAPKVDPNIVFDAFTYSFSGDGARAIRIVEKIEKEQDPYMFLGLLATQAIKKFETRQGMKEKLVLKMLARLDNQIKMGEGDAWRLIKITLLEIAQIK